MTATRKLHDTHATHDTHTTQPDMASELATLRTQVAHQSALIPALVHALADLEDYVQSIDHYVQSVEQTVLTEIVARSIPGAPHLSVASQFGRRTSHQAAPSAGDWRMR